MLTYPTNDAPLRQMIREAIGVHPSTWTRNFPNNSSESELTRVRELFDIYTRCIALTLGAVYPDTAYDPTAMGEWSRDLSRVRRALAETAEERYMPIRGLDIAVRRLMKLSIADATNAA
jgi:hypothetical protein